MKKIILVMIIALLLPVAAQAANRPDNRLDVAASALAGHPVEVWCEDTWSSWILTGFQLFNQDWSFLAGFTFAGDNTIFVSPRACETLHALLNYGPNRVGSYYASSAVLTLVHEAMHQRGISNEGEADCNALNLIRSAGVSYFGYRVQEQQQYVARVVKRVKGKRVVTPVVRTRLVPSPTLAQFYNDAVSWHRSKPAEYQGNC